MVDDITSEISIDAPVERVWALITQPEHLGTWFGDAGAEVELRPGGRFVLRWEEHGETVGRVETVEPPHRFAFRWLAYHLRDADELTDETSTRVEFTLTATDGGGTQVRVVETGFAALRGGAEAVEGTRAGNVRGWKAELGELGEYAERQPA